MNNLIRRFPIYSKLLYLYPTDYRVQYGEQMLQTLADMLDDPAQNHIAAWGRTVFDFPLSVIRQQVVYAGGVMATLPPYLKHNAFVGAWMVAPFFIFVTLNAILHQRLYNSFVWHRNVLFAWIVILPAVAVILNLASLFRWMQQRRQETGQSIWRVLTDFHKSWPALTIAIIGLGILALVFGHDSVHCVGGNPVQELANWHQTIQCIQQR